MPLGIILSLKNNLFSFLFTLILFPTAFRSGGIIPIFFVILAVERL